MLYLSTTRNGRRLARSAERMRVRREVALVLQMLESRELLTGTSLLWSTGVALPAPRGAAAVALVNGATVVAGGSTTGSATAVVSNTPTTSSWATLPSVNSGRFGPGFVSTSKGLLFYGGGTGTNGTTASSSAFLYDITGRNSHSAPSLSTARMQFATATDATSQAYAIGGVSSRGTNLASVERYNATSNAWTTVASLPAALSGESAAFDGTGSIYVVGGSPTVNGTTGTNTLYKYTVSTNTWSTLASLPLNIRDAAAVFGPDGKLDVIGGISNGSTVASVESYDPSSNTWSTNTALPAPVSSATAIVNAAGRIDVIGGFNASKQPQSTVTVSQIVNSPVAAPAFTSTPAASSLTIGTGTTFTYTATTSGNPLTSYSVTTGPSGMTIDPVNGSLSWTAPTNFVGSVPVTLTAKNALGSTTQSFSITVNDTTPPTVPTSFVQTGIGATSVTVSWAASTDNVGVAGYSVYWIYTVGHSGRGGGYTTYTVLEATTDGSTTSATIGGLTQGKSYSLYVRANDAAGNRSGYAGPLNVIPGALPYALGVTQGSSGIRGYSLSDVANHLLTAQLSATSFSPPTYSLVNPPSGMTLDPNTGILTWTPTASNVGTTNVTFQATNQFGSTSLTVPITVTADVPIPGFVFTNTDSPTFDLVGYPISLQITDGSNTPSTFSIDSGAPPGMTIDPVTGVVNWVPTQAGNPQLTFRLTNSAGTATILLGPVISVASPPQDLNVTGLNTWSPVLNWQPPAYNADLVASYRIYINGTSGLNYTYNVGDTLSTSLSYLSAGSFIVNIQPLDAAGNQGDWTSLSFDYNPTVPNPSYWINSNNSNPSIQVGQAASLQLYDSNTAYPSTFSLVSGPAGVSVNPNSGLVSWTPTTAQIGLSSLTFQFTNSTGATADLTIPFFVGPSTTDTNPPSPTYAFTSNGGDSYAVAGQAMTIQITDQNTAQPSGYLLVSGPSGMAVDPNTGLLTWTPTTADIGSTAYPVIEAINTAGVTYLYPSIPVYFASAMNNVTATGSLSTGEIDVAWTDPAAVSGPIAGYAVYLSWVDSTGTTQFALEAIAPAASTGIALIVPDLTVSTYTIYIAAFDENGNESPLSSTGTTITLS